MFWIKLIKLYDVKGLRTYFSLKKTLISPQFLKRLCSNSSMPLYFLSSHTVVRCGCPIYIYTGGAKSQYLYVGSYTTVVFNIRGLLLCKWHTVVCTYLFEDSVFKIWKFEYFRPRPFNIKTPILLALNMLNALFVFRDGRLLNVPSDLKKWGKTD